MYYAALHRKKQQLNPAICATRPACQRRLRTYSDGVMPVTVRN